MGAILVWAAITSLLSFHFFLSIKSSGGGGGGNSFANILLVLFNSFAVFRCFNSFAVFRCFSKCGPAWCGSLFMLSNTNIF